MPTASWHTLLAARRAGRLHKRRNVRIWACLSSREHDPYQGKLLSVFLMRGELHSLCGTRRSLMASIGSDGGRGKFSASYRPIRIERTLRFSPTGTIVSGLASRALPLLVHYGNRVTKSIILILALPQLDPGVAVLHPLRQRRAPDFFRT